MKNIVFVKYRKVKGISQVELAQELGISKDYVNMIENNRRNPSFSLAKKFADFFGTTVDNLFFHSNKERVIEGLQSDVRQGAASGY